MPIASLSDPPARCAPASLSDADDFTTFPVRGVSFGTAGALKVLTAGGDTVTVPSGALAVGVIHPMQLRRVFSTGTTAADIVLWG